MQVYNNENNKVNEYSNTTRRAYFPRSELNDWVPRWEKLVFFLIGFLGLQLIASLVSIIATNIIYVSSTNGTISNEAYYNANALVNFFSYLILVIIFVLFIFLDKRGTYKRLFSDFKKKETYIWALIGFGLVMCIQYFFSLLYQNTVPFYGNNDNQSSIVTLCTYQPALIFIMSVFMAPFCEELTYRLGLLDLIGHKYSRRVLGIIISAVIFGLIHTDFITTFESLSSAIAAEESASVIQGYREAFINEILNFPIYICSGLALGFTYAKSGKLASSMSSHFLVNLFSMISIFISMGTTTNFKLL